MRKKNIIMMILAIIMILSLCSCQKSEVDSKVTSWENDETLLAIQEDYGIDFTYEVPAEDSDYYMIIHSDNFADLNDATKLNVFVRIKDEGNFFSCCTRDGYLKIISKEDIYTAEVGFSMDEEYILYKNDSFVYSSDNPNYDAEKAESLKNKETETTEETEERDYSDLKWEPTIGMTTSEVYDTTWGAPDKKNVTQTEYGTVEQWVYYDLGYVYFTDGICDSIQYEEDYLN